MGQYYFDSCFSQSDVVIHDFLPEVWAFSFSSIWDPWIWTYVVSLRDTHLRHWEERKVRKKKMKSKTYF